MKIFDPGLIQLEVSAATSEEAIKQAGNLLVQWRHVEERYVEAMVDSYRKYGPYFVIAPGIAVPHARPEDGVKKAALSMIQLKEGTPFGSKMNDPVHLVFALAADSDQGHLDLLKDLSVVLGDTEKVRKLKWAKNLQDIDFMLKGDRNS